MSTARPIVVVPPGRGHGPLGRSSADPTFVAADDLPAAVSCLRTLREQGEPAALAVIGPESGQPLTVARELRRVDDAIGLAFVVDRPRTEATETKLGLVPELAGAIVLAADTPADELSSALRSAADAAVRRRHVQSVVDEMNRRLLSHAADTGREARRRGVSESYLAAVMRYVPEAIIALESDSTVVSLNEAACETFGLTPADAEGRGLADLLPARPADALYDAIADARAERPQERQEMWLQRADGEELLAWVTAAPVHDHQGHTVGIVVLAQDITAERHAADRLRQLQKAESLATLAGGVAHDFNNLLVTIAGWAELASEDLEDADTIGVALERISGSAKRAAELARAMLAYSGRGSFQIEPTDVPQLVEDLSGLLRASVDRQIAVELDLQDGLPTVRADQTQLRQIIMNLVTNASEAIGDADGAISISCGATTVPHGAGEAPGYLPAGEYVTLEVTDTGPGIDQSNLGRVFDPFFTTKFAGRGLGLAASHGIARAHGGTLVAESEPGRGATFRLLLPVSDGTPG